MKKILRVLGKMLFKGRKLYLICKKKTCKKYPKKKIDKKTCRKCKYSVMVFLDENENYNALSNKEKVIILKRNKKILKLLKWLKKQFT